MKSREDWQAVIQSVAMAILSILWTLAGFYAAFFSGSRYSILGANALLFIAVFWVVLSGPSKR